MAKKTVRTLIDAFSKIINEKPYNDITIQDILDESKISRSTFYAHYKTKDELLSAITDSIFHHVFSHSLEEENSHDFSKSSIFDYTHLFTHILYHLSDDRVLIKGILSSQGKDIFLRDLRKYLDEFADACLKNNFVPLKDMPYDLRKYLIVEEFLSLLTYWINNKCKETPEKLTEYYLKTIK